MCSVSFLRPFAMFLGLALTLVSVLGICASLYLVFGEPLKDFTIGTYTPNWEDVGEIKSFELQKISFYSNSIFRSSFELLSDLASCECDFDWRSDAVLQEHGPDLADLAHDSSRHFLGLVRIQPAQAPWLRRLERHEELLFLRLERRILREHGRSSSNFWPVFVYDAHCHPSFKVQKNSSRADATGILLRSNHVSKPTILVSISTATTKCHGVQVLKSEKLYVFIPFLHE